MSGDLSSYLPIILASAGTAALISALINLVGSMFDRRARERELLLKLAYDLAVKGTDRAIEVAKDNKERVNLQDHIVSMETYYKWLKILYKKGKLPDDPIIERF